MSSDTWLKVRSFCLQPYIRRILVRTKMTGEQSAQPVMLVAIACDESK